MATKSNNSANQNSNQQNQNQGSANSLMDSATAMMGGLGGNLSNLPDNVKQIGTAALNQFNKLSTTQKVIGGAALLIGAGYLARRSNMNWSSLGAMAKKATGSNGKSGKNKNK